jgi:hypothetical protein
VDLPQARVRQERQAQAVVRIVRPVRVRLNFNLASTEESVLRSATVTDGGGTSRPASLIEFY